MPICGEVRRDGVAREVWGEVYGRLTADRPGLLGAVTSRAEAQVTRLSLLYADLRRGPARRRGAGGVGRGVRKAHRGPAGAARGGHVPGRGTGDAPVAPLR